MRQRLILLLTFLWILPAILMAGMVWRYAVDVPYGDDFATGETLYKSVTAGLQWSDLIAQHNESRPLFPRLLFNTLGKLSRWDLRWQMAASLLMVECTALVLLLIIRRSIADPLAACLLALLANILLFSPVQWDNFLWGIQFIVFVPALSLAMIMLLLGSSLSMWVVTPLAAFAAIVATYSNSNGLLVWFVPLGFFVLHPSKSRFAAMAVWMVLALAAAGYYFHGYQSPGNPSIAAVIKQPADAAQFILAFIGNGVRLDTNVDHAVKAGLAAVCVWVAGVLFIALAGRDIVVWRSAMPWITFGLYSLTSAALAMSGRLILFGIPGAISERYPTFAIPIWIAVVPLWAVIFRHFGRKKSVWERCAVAITCMMSACILMLTCEGYLFVRKEMRAYNAHRLAGRVVAQFSLVVRDNAATAATLYPDPAWAIRVLTEMDRIDYLPFQCFRTSDINAIAVSPATDNAGHFDQLAIAQDHLIASGWACIPTTGNLADAILFTTPDNRGINRIFAIVWQDRIERPDVQRQTHRPLLGRSGWIRELDRSRFVPGAVISAWAFDSYARRAYPIAGMHRVP